MKKYLVTAAFLGTFALTVTGASAAVICNDDGDCWKVKEKYAYPPDVHVQAYDDDWKWEGDKYRWARAGGWTRLLSRRRLVRAP